MKCWWEFHTQRCEIFAHSLKSLSTDLAGSVIAPAAFDGLLVPETRKNLPLETGRQSVVLRRRGDGVGFISERLKRDEYDSPIRAQAVLCGF